MAKKIIITFYDIPVTTGNGFSFTIKRNGTPIVYNSGKNTCLIVFIQNGSIPASINEIAVGTTLAQTLEVTLNHLRTHFVNSIINYNIVSNTIEVDVNSDDVITFGPVNDNIIILQENVSTELPNLKYYINFEDYYLSITQKGYLGFSTEIYGQIQINKGSVDSILEPIRGTGLNLALEANSTLTFDEFGLADEMTYFVQLKKNNHVLFNGFIKPDGIQQSWVNDEWLVNIEVIDGLGAMKDLSFVQSNGTHFTGKLSFYEVIKGCLDRTGLSMTINTSIDLLWDGYAGTNMLKDTFINTSRFIKNEQDPVLMDCNAVLTSVLNLFSAVITQEYGQWWIYRPNDLVLNQYTNFINQTTNITFTKNLSAVLGSQIDNFYPHHCDNNQQIEMKGAISAYRLNYEYGFLDGFITNKDLTHTSNMLYSGWTVIEPSELINDPLDNSGAIIYSDFNQIKEVMISAPFTVLAGAILNPKIKLSTTFGRHFFRFKLKTSDGKYVNNIGVWGTNSSSYFQGECGQQNRENATADFSFLTEPVPNNCTVQIIICQPTYAAVYSNIQLTEITHVDVTDTTQTQTGRVGEFHTVSRKNPPSSITKENQTVFNGDSGILFIGSIYKTDKINVTEKWYRKNKSERSPLLRISAEDDLRIQCNPIKVFSGGIYGQLPYLSVITINNIVGLFMFTEYSYDIYTRKVSGKLTQFYNNDLGDIAYLFSYDYGNNTIKPTIKG